MKLSSMRFFAGFIFFGRQRCRVSVWDARTQFSTHEIFTHCSLPSNLLTTDCIFDVIVSFVVVHFGLFNTWFGRSRSRENVERKLRSVTESRPRARFGAGFCFCFFFFHDFTYFGSAFPIPGVWWARTSDFPLAHFAISMQGAYMCFKRTSEVICSLVRCKAKTHRAVETRKNIRHTGCCLTVTRTHTLAHSVTATTAGLSRVLERECLHL